MEYRVFGAALGLGIASAVQAGAGEPTLFGTVDLGLAHLRSGGGSNSGMAQSGGNISRLGLRGTEDWGGGYGAGFWLEAGYNPSNGKGFDPGGGMEFNRRATVSALGPYGELRLGRDDSVGFLSTLLFDPFLTNGVGGTSTFGMLGAPIQISNALSYFLPRSLGGFHGQLQYAWSPSSTPESTRYKGVRAGYADGPLSVAVTVAHQGNTRLPGLSLYNVAASYDFGALKPSFILAQEERGASTVRALQLGVSAPIGPHLLRASIARYAETGGSGADWSKYSVGYGYNFSKATMFYASYAYLHNSAGSRRAIQLQGLASPPNIDGHNAQGYQVGLRKFF